MGSRSICKRHSDCCPCRWWHSAIYTGKIIRSGILAARSEVANEREREEQLFRVAVCYRSNDHNCFLSPVHSFYSVSLPLHRLIPVPVQPARIHPVAHTSFCSTPVVCSFLCRFFLIFLPLHFAATGFHGQLISSRSVCSNPFLIPVVSSIARELALRSPAKIALNFRVLNGVRCSLDGNE